MTLLASTSTRTLEGLLVPFGVVGYTSMGPLTYAAGSITWHDDLTRVKLLREHDATDVVIGHAVELREVDGPIPGLWGRFAVAEGDDGDRALVEAAANLRDGFSVGVFLDTATLRNLFDLDRDPDSPVAASGILRETSTVAIPAFDDARAVAGDTAPALAAASGRPVTWSPTRARPARAVTWSPTRARPARASQITPGTAPNNERQNMSETTPAPGTPGTDPTPAPAPDPTPATPAPTPAQPDPTQPATSSAPATLPAVAGSAHVGHEAPVYSFAAASGHSIVRDLANAALRRDSEAADRVERFNAQLRDGNPGATAQLATAAVATRTDVDGAGTDLPSMFAPSPNRPELMRTLVDVRRPFVSRLDRVPISNAQPFAIPKVGEFTGVGPHTEGTPHRPAGTLELSGDVVQPTATSGAWEVSRELLDAATPALDRIAARAMLRDYQRQTEGKVVALVAARALEEGSTIYGVDTALELRGAMLDTVNDDDESADLVVLSRGLLRTLALDTDTTDRPQFPFVGATNAVGAYRAGGTGITVDGVEVVRSARLDTDSDLGADSGVIARSEGILWAESNVLQFRFDEVLGPGVIKLALWAYSGAAILDASDVMIVRSSADPTP